MKAYIGSLDDAKALPEGETGLLAEEGIISPTLLLYVAAMKGFIRTDRDLQRFIDEFGSTAHRVHGKALKRKALGVMHRVRHDAEAIVILEDYAAVLVFTDVDDLIHVIRITDEAISWTV